MFDFANSMEKLLISLDIMWKGMLSIMLAIFVIMIIVFILSKIDFGKLNKDTKK